MATYKSSKELEGKILQQHDDLEFCVRGRTLRYRVHPKLLVHKNGLNSEIFGILEIKDRFAYAKKYYQEAANFATYQIFPECTAGSYKALTRLAIALFKECEKLQEETKPKESLESIYKVGDRVKVKAAYDPGCSSRDYPCGFLRSMLEGLGGKIVTITKVAYVDETLYSEKMRYLEPFIYKIAEGGFTWSAAMFEGKVKDTLSEDFSAKVPIYPERSNDNFYFTKEDMPTACPYHPYVIDQALVEFSKGVREDIKDPEEAFKVCIRGYVGSWFDWDKTSQGRGYWLNIYKNPSFVPSYYIPTYFIEELPSNAEELVEYCKKDISDTIAYCSSKTSHNYIEIPCNYEEVTLSIKKKKVHF